MVAPRKILAVKLRALGDTVLMTAPLLELRKSFPNAEIHVVVTRAWATLLEGHPAVDKIWFYDRHREATARARAIAGLALKLRKEKFDWAINFHASPSSATLCYALGAKTRSIHFHGHKDKNRYSTVVVPGKGVLKPVIERDMDTIRALGVNAPVGVLPQIFLRNEEIESAKRKLAGLGLPGPYLCLGIGASRPTKRWPMDRYASIALRWCDETQGSVLVFNSLDETRERDEFYAEVGKKSVEWYIDPRARHAVRDRIHNETQIELRQMAALFQLSTAYFGNDSGPKHIAVASGLKTLTVFGPEDPFEWHPYPTDRHPYLFIEGLPCRRDHEPGMRPWCGLHECKIEEHRCMKKILEDDALRALRKLAPEFHA